MPPTVALRPELATAADRYDRLRAVVDALVGRGEVEPSLARTRSWTAAGRRGRWPVPPAAVLYEWLRPGPAAAQGPTDALASRRPRVAGR